MEHSHHPFAEELTKTSCTHSLNAVRDTLYVLGGKWKLPVILVLKYGPRRFTDLQRQVEGITPKLLSKELKELEVNGFIVRRVHPTTPVLIEYELTEYSKSLDSIIVALRDWGLQHRQYVQSL
jgi:DNA-binding HxlR family transcriptional regulator